MLGALAWALVLVVGTATPAGADPAGPSDFRSAVTGIEPAVDGVTAEIRGGDSFLELSVDDGVEVTVGGYEGEPYLQFLADGTVQRNRLSSATYLNEDRKGAVEIPAEVEAAMDRPTTPPDWETVATDGTYAWHDHRVHWMGEASPPVGRGERVGGAYDPWRVPITVDGTPADVTGTLTYEESTSPLPWLALAVVVAAGLAVLAKRAGGVRLVAGALVVASGLAVVTGRGDWASTPDGTGNPLLWILPVVALVAAAAAVGLAARSAGVVLALAAVAALSGWALFRFQALLKPVLPTDLPAGLDRLSLALALGAAAAGAIVAVTSGTFAFAELEDDE
ncbi:MAG: hypothetical protein ACO1PW_12490 [Actinomycetota bacterium]